MRSGKTSGSDPHDGKTAGISLNAAKHYFWKVAEKVCPGYVIDNENRAVIETLLLYFTNNPEFEQQTSIQAPALKKGILLAGNIGTGKTLLMHILRDCRFLDKRFGIKTCREVSQQYAAEGMSGILLFGSKAVRYEYGSQKINHMLFDDLGAEKSLNHYGNKMNVMAELLQDRNEHFLKYGLLTYLTTNMDLEEIESYFGNRVLSRMYQLFNFITLGGEKTAMDRQIINVKK